MGLSTGIGIGIGFNRGSQSWESYFLTRTPSNLVAKVISGTQINLIWDDGLVAASGIRIYISTDNITFNLKGTAEFGTELYSATGLTTGILYYFYIVAYNGTNESDASNVVSATPEIWYLAGGVTAANCKVAYQPVGAANIAASYVNLANPGTNDAALGEAPVFSTVTGWKFNGTSNYLRSGITPTANHTMIVLFSGVTSGIENTNIVAGSNGATSARFYLRPERYVAVGGLEDHHFGFATGAVGLITPNLTDGVMAIAGSKGYKNGTLDAIMTGTWAGTGAEIYIGCYNSNGTLGLFFNGYVQAIAIYDTILTDNQIYMISRQMVDAFNPSLTKDSFISYFGCFGMPAILSDPNNAGKHIITNQKYSTDPEIDEDVMYSIYDDVKDTYTLSSSVFNVSSEATHQGHPQLDYFGNKYHVGYAQSSDETYTDGLGVDIESTVWADFAERVLSEAETPATAEAGWRPWFWYLKMSATTVWMLYTTRIANNRYVAYSIWDSITGWDQTQHLIAETQFVSAGVNDILAVGTAIKDGDNIFIYYAKKVYGSSYVFMVIKSTDNGATWGTAADMGITGIGWSARPMVKKYGSLFVMIYNAISGIHIMRSDAGLVFITDKIIKDCYSYPVDFIILDATHILVIWGIRDSIVEDSAVKDNLYGSVIYIGNYLT
jgi:hypothetical protein